MAGWMGDGVGGEAVVWVGVVVQPPVGWLLCQGMYIHAPQQLTPCLPSPPTLPDTGARVVVGHAAFGEMALHFIEKHGMMAVRIPSKFELRRFCRATGAACGSGRLVGWWVQGVGGVCRRLPVGLGETKSTERQVALCTPAMNMPCHCSNARTIAVRTSSRASGAVSLVKLQAPAADELGYARSLAVQASWALAGWRRALLSRVSAWHAAGMGTCLLRCWECRVHAQRSPRRTCGCCLVPAAGDWRHQVPGAAAGQQPGPDQHRGAARLHRPGGRGQLSIAVPRHAMRCHAIRYHAVPFAVQVCCRATAMPWRNVSCCIGHAMPCPQSAIHRTSFRFFRCWMTLSVRWTTA